MPSCATCAALTHMKGPKGTMQHLCQRHPPQISVMYMPGAPMRAPGAGIMLKPGAADSPQVVTVEVNVNSFWPAMDPKNDSHGCFDWIAKDTNGKGT